MTKEVRRPSPQTLLLAGCALVLTITASIIACATTGPAKRTLAMKNADHYMDGKFHNLIPGEDPMTRGGMWDTLWEFIADRSTIREPTDPLPIVPRRAEEFQALPQSRLRVTWLGHSTVLIEIDGVRILTDPMWGNRASPFRHAGPKRFFKPPLPLEALPPLDAVVISHDHYDHLDEDTIKKMQSSVPLFLVPLKVGAILEEWGVPREKIRELDWWQEANVGDVRLVCSPARHFSGRGLFGGGKTLWSSWAMVGPLHRVYFSGDGGMSPSFAEIGKRLGPFDITMMEVGAYNTRWADIHTGPEQAVQAHLDLQGKLMLPIHWGTFNLALHAWTEPAERVIASAHRLGAQTIIPRPGESVTPDSLLVTHPWWPSIPWKTAEEDPVISPGLGDLSDGNLVLHQGY